MHSIIAALTGLLATFNNSQIVTLVGYLGGLNAHQMVQLVNCLHPSLNAAETLDLLNVLQTDGLNGLRPMLAWGDIFIGSGS